MNEIDGADGGGQVVRTAVALSALSGESIRIENVRGDRPEPGMSAQHCTAVEAAAALCDGSVEGRTLGSKTLVFEPGELQTDDVTVDIGTAGSISLVFDTVLPLATAIDEPVDVTVSGGTDVEWAPPIEYFRRVKLPLLSDIGLNADISVDSRGFYPLGGGTATLSMRPSSLSTLDAEDRGSLRRVEVYSTATTELEEADVAERQAMTVAEDLDDDTSVGIETAYVDADCPGSSLVLVAVSEDLRAGFSALGAAGKPSEDVASEAIDDFQQFHDSDAAVDSYLGDQLLVYLALAGGTVRLPELTDHVETNRSVIETFGYDFEESRDGLLLRTLGMV